MIRYIEHGDLFASQAEALVNPVNCVGVMGKGLALEFKRRFPQYLPTYQHACDVRALRPGRPLCVRVVVQPEVDGLPPAMIMFPTKDHWKGKSQIEWIERGLAAVKEQYQAWGLRSIAMPQVGCGLGGLRWDQVQPLIEQYLGDEPLEVEVYVSAVTQYKEKGAAAKLPALTTEQGKPARRRRKPPAAVQEPLL
jgi:O-acetyl-ADP-ribose deacetylase (regulator of RNase III)